MVEISNAWQWQRCRQASKCVTEEVCFQFHDSSPSFYCALTEEILMLSQYSEHRSPLPFAVPIKCFCFSKEKNQWKTAAKWLCVRLATVFSEGQRCYSQLLRRITARQWHIVFALQNINTAERGLVVAEKATRECFTLCFNRDHCKFAVESFVLVKFEDTESSLSSEASHFSDSAETKILPKNGCV